MPGGMVSSLVGWVATHLVVLSLLGFVFAGLQVFGLIGPPGDPRAESSVGVVSGGVRQEIPAAPATGAADAAGRGELQQALRDDDTVQSAPLQEKPARRKTPKLIGGTLPLYEQSQFGAPLEEPAAAVGDPGFRPRAEGLPAEAPPPMRDDLVQRARRAFWNGDFEAAETAYIALVSAYPEDADGFGELGNLYQSMGRTDAALDAYFEAGVRLKAIGEEEKLSKIIELMTREGDPRVQELTP